MFKIIYIYLHSITCLYIVKVICESLIVYFNCMRMMTISIIVPIYNVEKYIGRCLDSIFVQDNNDVDIECILVNDCTPDNSMGIVAKKLEYYHGKIIFKIKNLDKNGGLCMARNAGVEIAKGEYVLFLDSDDRLLPDSISIFVEALREADASSSIDVVLGNTYICKNEAPAMKFCSEEPIFVDNEKEDGLRKLMRRELYHTAWNKLVKRELLLMNHIQFENGIIDEDLLWSYLVFLNARNILVIPKITYIYENNPGSIVNTTSAKLALAVNSRMIICNKIMDSPPKERCREYYLYIFFIIIRAIDLYESDADALHSLKYNLFSVRNRLLSNVWKNSYYLLILFFLISIKPFYYITKLRLFRRYYDRIAKCFLLF